MSLKQWADNGWLREHRSSAKEIAGLLSIVNRDLKDAGRVEGSLPAQVVRLDVRERFPLAPGGIGP